MECPHDFANRDHAHHLIYRGKLKKEDEKKVVCSWCYEPIWDSLYSCIECCFHPVHRYSSINHCLVIIKKLENVVNMKVVCSVCDEPILGVAYKCSVSGCSFVIHNLCTKLSSHINDHRLHPEHTLSLKQPRRNSCDVCCTSHDRSFFYDCSLCDFELDIKCAYDPLLFNPNDCHQHKFVSILRQVQFNCDTCGEEITNLAYRVCTICKLMVHYKCLQIPRAVKIKLHNHFLSLIYYPHKIKKHDNMRYCRICYERVNTKYAAYYCQKCRYVVHLQCIKLYEELHIESDLIKAKRFKDLYGESVPIAPATYLIKSLNQALNQAEEEAHCGEITHFSHQQHKLILCNDEVDDDKLCQGCMEFIISVPFYSCGECKFFLHTQCAKLPKKIEQHRLHYFHTLTLLPRAPTKSGVFFCDICSRNHRGFTYKCDLHWCGCTLDVQCGSIPETLKHDGHEHSLFFAQDSKGRKCKACPKDNEKYIFVCISCDFTLGIRCANLPLVAKHKYDTHLLKLNYNTTIKDCGEYYCLICEEERDPNHWFYYCEECDFTAHPKCVLGNYPCSLIGNTYISDYHQHPLNFVQTTRDNRCKACPSRFVDLALECSQCKFTVHPPRPYFPDCLWKLSEKMVSFSSD